MSFKPEIKPRLVRKSLCIRDLLGVTCPGDIKLYKTSLGVALPYIPPTKTGKACVYVSRSKYAGN